MYQTSLNTEDKQRFETYKNPFVVMGPREKYYTMQKGNRRYDTVITQTFDQKEAPESHDEEQSDPALGSEYVSFPQDNLKENGMEQYWDYVPIDNRLDFPRSRHNYLPAQGVQRSVANKVEESKDLKTTGKSKNDSSQARAVFNDRHSVGESKDTSGSKSDAKISEKHSPSKKKQSKEEERGRKRQQYNVNVRNRSPEPSGKCQISIIHSQRGLQCDISDA